MTEAKVLVPVEILEGETVSQGVIELLSNVDVVILGYHVLPEQTPPGQARMQYEDRAQSDLDEIKEAFKKAGGKAETRLVFTHEKKKTFDRTADDEECNAVMILNPAMKVERVLVPVLDASREDSEYELLGSVVSEIVSSSSMEVTVYDATGGSEAIDVVFEAITQSGDEIRKRVTKRVASAEEAETPMVTTAEISDEYDAVVMLESSGSVEGFIFGKHEDQIAEKSLNPIVVVRRETLHEEE